MPEASEPSSDWPELVRRFDRPDVRALVLTGSQARGDAGPFSDVDLVRFTVAKAPASSGAGSHLLNRRLVVVSDVDPEELETHFSRPELALSRIPGLREGRALRDREGFFAALQARARAFVWDAAMQARADAFANEAMAGWSEEVHKGLGALGSGDVGRLLDAGYGLSWGLNRVVEVQRGILQAGGGDGFVRVEQAVGPDTAWARLRRRVFGASTTERPPTLRERVVAGLRFYVATAELLDEVWRPPADQLVDHAVRLVRDALGEEPAPIPAPDAARQTT